VLLSLVGVSAPPETEAALTPETELGISCYFSDEEEHMRMTHSPVSWLPLAATLLMVGCSPLRPPPGKGRGLGYTPQGEAGAVTAKSPTGRPEPRQPQRQHRHREIREDVTGVPPGSVGESAVQSVSFTREAVLNAVNEVTGTLGVIGGALPGLASKPGGLGNRVNGAFTRYIDYGAGQLPWLRGALGEVILLAGVAAEVEDAECSWRSCG